MNTHIFNAVKQRAELFVKENATTILTAGGVVGTVGTSVLAWRGGYKAGEIVQKENSERGDQDQLATQSKVQLVWMHAVPPVISGGATIGAIIMANRMSAQKAAALAAAYGMAQGQLEEYKAKVQEKLTGPKAQAIRDEIQQDRVNENPPNSQVIIIGSGEVLCYDAFSGRYFKTSVEAIRRAENAVHKEILNSNEASLRSFYDELELPPITMDEHLGWNINHPMSVEISTVLSPDEEPCLALEFTELPIMDFRVRY